MNQRALLSIGVLAVGLSVCGFVLSGVGAHPSRPAIEPPPAEPPATASPAAGRTLSGIASPPEAALWSSRGCVTCHGPEARGSMMAPDLTKVVPLYLARFGEEGAKAKIAEYLIDPKGSPKLRDDGQVFPNPMPAIEKLFGGTRDDAPVLAGLLVRLAK